ncbi:MAG: outer membrane beta-barrel protein [Candidatus Latescibacteria bacterium]|nr:outer membrane beta-barrel protein [bacterium]MBD3423642.1 outer membrane beta-barrel protein [Candidatus Latescibacterota bacterium]
MKTNNALSIAGITVIFLLAFSGAVMAQASAPKNLVHFGGTFNVPIGVEDSDNPSFGGNIFVGKMFNRNLCVGFKAGFDIISMQKTPTNFYKYLGVIPFALEAKYLVNMSRMFKVYGAASAGVYRTQVHLGGQKVGSVTSSANCPGGSISVGVDYWFLLTNGVGAELEYNMFKVPDGGDFNSYLTLKVNYCRISF